MTYSKQTTIWCDEKGCSRWEQHNTSRVSEARESLSDGWTYEDGQDYCPRHGGNNDE